MVEITDIIGNPTWLAHRYAPEQDAIHFVQASRKERASATFLTDEHLPTDARKLVVGRDDAMRAAPSPAPLHFIFHSAFCCSTLLARAFEDAATVLKEPPILNDIVGWRHLGAQPARVAQILDQVATLLARPLTAGETVIVKPTNIANVLARALLAMRQDAKAVILHAPLEVYLRSIAKKQMTGRLWVRELLIKLLREGLVDLGFQNEDYVGQTDLQVAAVGWLAQQALFARLVDHFGTGRVRTLDSETLLEHPHDILSDLNDHFGLRMTSRDVAAAVAGPAFTQHSKSNAEFGIEARAREYADAAAAHQDELNKVVVWAKAVADSAQVPMQLPGAIGV